LALHARYAEALFALVGSENLVAPGSQFGGDVGQHLQSEFKMLANALAPLAGVLTRIFPGITDFVFSWLQPGISSLKYARRCLDGVLRNQVRCRLNVEISAVDSPFKT
jgi:hypothetical protein